MAKATTPQAETPQENQNNNFHQNRHFGCFEKIWSSEYDAELDMVQLEVLLCNGDFININLMGHHIKELYLFLQKEHAQERYMSYVMKK